MWRRQTFAVLIGLAQSIQTSLLAQFPVSAAKKQLMQTGFRFAVARYFRKKITNQSTEFTNIGILNI